MSKTTILIVDDEPMMTEVVQLLLPLYLDVEVVATNLPHQALKIISQLPVSLLITDYFMPGMNGLELIKNVRQQGLSLPIIVLTGYYDNPELRQGAGANGSYEIMEKPWSNARLVERIKILLEGEPLAA